MNAFRSRTLVSTALSFALAGIASAKQAPEPVALVDRERSATDLARYERVGRSFVDRETGAIISSVDIDAGPYEGTPEAMARAYLDEHGAGFGIGGTDDLSLDYVKDGLWAHHVRFHQSLNGVRVLESEIVVNVRKRDAHVVSVASRYRVGAEAAAAVAALTEAAAREVAVSTIGAGEGRIGEEQVSLVYYAERRPFPLAYRVIIPAAQPLGDWEVLVDASTGAVLRLRDQAVYATGSGLAFDPDPLTTANTDYGASGYTDGNDASTPQLESQQFTRTLQDISFSGGVYRLQGPFCTLVDFESPNIPPVTNADPDAFVHDRSQSGFEDVNVYWGIDFTQRWIQSLGFTNIQNTSIQCDPHGLSGADNSHYIPSSNRLAWGDGGVDDAEDQDVVWHEYGHAIQFGSQPGWGGGHQPDMGEGFGDYWAGSHSAAVEDYRDNWVFNWDGHNPFWSGRVLDYGAHYPEGLGPFIHTNGQMWSSTLMSAWRETCREHIDRVTLDHHFTQGTFALFSQAAAFWVSSDLNIHDGLNVDTYVHFATERGFFLPGEYDMPSVTHTPLPDTGDSGPFTVTATITAQGEIIRGEVHYGVGGTEDIDQVTIMWPSGDPDEWTGSIPPLGSDIDISYFVVGIGAQNLKTTHPRAAPCGGSHTFHVDREVVSAGIVAARGRNALEPVRPNPFEPQAAIVYSLEEAGAVKLEVFDVSGALVRTLVDGLRAADRHAVTWDGRDDRGARLASGVYLYRLIAGEFSSTRKLTLIE